MNASVFQRNDRVKAFQSALRTEPVDQMLERYVFQERSAMLTDDDEKDLLQIVAQEFEISDQNVLVVGSAKLGFRLFPKPPKHECGAKLRFSDFDDDSDIDVAIFSPKLFESYWKRVYDFFRDAGFVATGDIGKTRTKFRKYLEQGWIRPDALPGTGSYDQKAEWLRRVGQINRKCATRQPVRLGLYFDKHFLVGYHTRSFEICRKELLGEHSL